jgi:hypothetical protein
LNGSKMERRERRNWMPAATFVIFFSLSLTGSYYLLNCDSWDENCCSPIASLTAKACDLLHEWALGSKSTLLK